MRIGIFDSGIGGLTVLKTLYNNYPNNDYIYYGDTINLPYGSKTKEELNNLSEHDVEFLIKEKVDMIIIACGTVSSNCLTHLKNKYSLPIYDIISPTIKYLNSSTYSNIGIIATSATINSNIFKNNLNKNVYQIETPSFVPLIEQNKKDEINIAIDNYLKEYTNKIDILVLGCTHYPIIKDELNKYFDNKIELLDMSNLLLDKLKNDRNSSIKIYYIKLNKTIIENTKSILEKETIDIYEKNNCQN